MRENVMRVADFECAAHTRRYVLRAMPAAHIRCIRPPQVIDAARPREKHDTNLLSRAEARHEAELQEQIEQAEAPMLGRDADPRG